LCGLITSAVVRDAGVEGGGVVIVVGWLVVSV